ncbi:MAG: tetratricopeptide repeat protein [Terriglobales bacterium]|jgi:tetratricopeptide (TPR) repeat protein
MTVREKVQGLGLYPTREPVILALLSALAIVGFLAVGGLSRMFHAQQEALANRWFTRGTGDLKDGHFDLAVGDFRAALRYSRDNYDYQLNLAQSLIGLKKTDEAYAYLINLWEREPENGLVNLELARIAAQKGQTEPALRYYHNAIYATWPGDQEVQRRSTRMELIEYLLGIKAKPQAQSELIALAANLGDDPALHQHVGDLFVQAQDYEHALAEYRLTLKSDHHNSPALAGAGLAAFDLGRYSLAQRYLQVAVAVNPGDEQSADLLKTTDLVLQMDPYQRQISADQRNRIVIEAFAAAGDRLNSCAATVNSSGTRSYESLEQSLIDSWAKMKPKINERDLRRDPDLTEKAMDLVFEIERQTKTACGAPTGTDLALLLIAKLHEGN